jgi:hypothetical protein
MTVYFGIICRDKPKIFEKLLEKYDLFDYSNFFSNFMVTALLFTSQEVISWVKVKALIRPTILFKPEAGFSFYN